MAAHPKKRKTNDVLCIKMFGSFSISQIPAKAMRDITTASGNASTAEIALARIDTFTSVESVAEITASLSGRAHRLWLLVAYLIVNRDHGVSPQELIDLLWPEVTSNNPASTLQNNVSRARALFSEANFDDARDLIKHTDGFIIGLPNVRLFSIQRSSRPMCVASETFFLLKILKESISLLKLVSFTRAIF